MCVCEWNYEVRNVEVVPFSPMTTVFGQCGRDDTTDKTPGLRFAFAFVNAKKSLLAQSHSQITHPTRSENRNLLRNKSLRTTSTSTTTTQLQLNLYFFADCLSWAVRFGYNCSYTPDIWNCSYRSSDTSQEQQNNNKTTTNIPKWDSRGP